MNPAIARRTILLLGPCLVAAAGNASGQTESWPSWIGSYSGAVRFYRSIPLEDAVPPEGTTRIDPDDRTPFGLGFAVRSLDRKPAVWLRIEGGPMQTEDRGETMRFGPVADGVAVLAGAEAHPMPRSATLTERPHQLATEALFAHADGTFWRRHFTATFTPAGADVILWVFDAAGTRARTWRGSTRRDADR